MLCCHGKLLYVSELSAKSHKANLQEEEEEVANTHKPEFGGMSVYISQLQSECKGMMGYCNIRN